jgi:hypothetical protein
MFLYAIASCDFVQAVIVLCTKKYKVGREGLHVNSTTEHVDPLHLLIIPLGFSLTIYLCSAEAIENPAVEHP